MCRGLGVWPQAGTGVGGVGGVGVGTWVSQSPGPCVGRGEGRGQGGQAQWAEQVAGGAHGEGKPSGVLAVIPWGWALLRCLWAVILGGTLPQHHQAAGRVPPGRGAVLCTQGDERYPWDPVPW